MHTGKAVGLVSLWTACLKAEVPFVFYSRVMCVAVCPGKECLSLNQARSSSRNWGYGHVLGCLWHCFPWRPRLPPPRSRSPWDLAGVSSRLRPHTPARSLALSAVTSWGIADRNLSAPHAGGIVRHLGLCFVVAFSPCHWRVLAAAAWRGVPAAAAAVAAAMVSPVTVVSERASERANVWRGRSPPAWGLGCCQPSHWGPREGRSPAAAGGCCQGPWLPRPAMPFLRLPPVRLPARPREGGTQWARDWEA